MSTNKHSGGKLEFNTHELSHAVLLVILILQVKGKEGIIIDFPYLTILWPEFVRPILHGFRVNELESLAMPLRDSLIQKETTAFFCIARQIDADSKLRRGWKVKVMFSLLDALAMPGCVLHFVGSRTLPLSNLQYGIHP